MLLFSCSIDTIVDEPSKMYNNYDSINNNVNNINEIDTNAILNIIFINDAKNVILNINQFYIKGIDELNKNKYIINDSLLYNDSLLFKNIKLLPQYIKENDVFVVIDGEVKTKNYLIYKGLIYVPIKSGYINEGENYLNLILYNNCSWFYYYDNKKCILLNSIEFDVDVENWKNDGKIINNK